MPEIIQTNESGDNSVTIIQEIVRNPTLLSDVVNELADKDIFIDELDVKSFNISDKFISNGLPDTKYQEIFAEVASVSFCLLAIYEELVSITPKIRLQILSHLNKKYLGEKRSGKSSVEILDAVHADLMDEILKSNNLVKTIRKEVIVQCVYIIIFDAFENCKVLEKPKDKK